MNALAIISDNFAASGKNISPIKLYNMIENPTYKLKDIINKDVTIVGYHTMPTTQFTDEESGEIIDANQTIIFLDNLETVSTYSRSFVKALKKLESAIGLGHKVKVELNDFKADDGNIIQYYKVIPQE